MLLFGITLGATAQTKAPIKVTKKTIVDAVSCSPEHKALAYFMHMDDPNGEYMQNGFFTVFAPTDAAIKQLPLDIVKNMENPQNVDVTHSIIKYHILAGKYTQQDILAAVKKGNGVAVFTTIQGGKLVFSAMGDYIKISDSEGHVANIRFNNITVGNGMVHSIDKVLMPKDEPQQVEAPTAVAGY